jgi:nicotinate-nucleotide adenylyltransferase
MRIGFFGGSFDPPHLGHLAVARAAAKAFSLNEILFAPTAYQPLKPSGAAAPWNDRLAMVTLLCANDPTFHPSTLDSPQNTPNYTVDTLQRLRSTLPVTDTIYSILGLDAFLDIHHWRSPETLLTLADWIVVTRPSFSPSQLKTLNITPTQLQRVHILTGFDHPASATEIRTLLAAGSDLTNLLPLTILTYIQTHHLYGTQPPRI